MASPSVRSRSRSWTIFEQASLTPLGPDSKAVTSEVSLYGDVVLRYVSHRDPDDRSSSFLPGFEPIDPEPLDFSLRRLDHAVGNVPELAPAVAYLKNFTGFHEFAEFTAEDVGTAESGLKSVVLANNDETVPPPTYYWNLKRRAGDVLTEEQIRECKELGILVDRDDLGVLLQILTKTVGDR